jgi:hypothetical protein
VDRRLLVDHVVRHDDVEHGFTQVIPNLLEARLLRVLRREDDGVDPMRPPIHVLDRHLGLAVGPQVGQGLVLAHARHLARQQVGEVDRHRHQLRGLIAGEAEHHSLVAGTARVDAPRDVRRLLVDRHDDATGVGVEAKAGAVVARLLNGLPDDIPELDVGIGGDLADHKGEAGGDGRLAGHPAKRILGHDGVEDRVGDLVGDLVRMPLGHRLRREEVRRTLHRVPDSQPLRYSACSSVRVSIEICIAASFRRAISRSMSSGTG